MDLGGAAVDLRWSHTAAVLAARDDSAPSAESSASMTPRDAWLIELVK
jgi:hypothetical protein